MNENAAYRSFFDFSKVRKNIIQANNDYGMNDLIFLIMSGSFNPIHSFHIEVFESAKSFFEKKNKTVLGGFIAPSSDEYLKDKLGKNAMPLSDRIACCKLAVEDSNWLSVCTLGERSSNAIQRQIKI